MMQRSDDAKARKRAREDRFKARHAAFERMSIDEYSIFRDEEENRLDREAEDLIQVQGLSPRTGPQKRGFT